jgi:cytochrome c-type biogenesis protein CcmH
LLSETPAEAPWAAALAARLAAVKGESASAAPASQAAASSQAPAAASSQAPAAASSAAAAGSDNDQQAQIRGMVERLATRLAQQGGDADAWGRLIRSYSVMREADKAREALATARKALAGDQSAGPKLDALAQQLGLEGGNASSAPAGEANAAPSAAPAAPASQAPAATSQAPAATSQAPAAAAAGPDDAQQAMIRGMVERLATRLSQSGGDADQWGRLIRAYSVMHEPDKARDALAAARKALAGDAAAGPGLDALARELGIGG